MSFTCFFYQGNSLLSWPSRFSFPTCYKESFPTVLGYFFVKSMDIGTFGNSLEENWRLLGWAGYILVFHSFTHFVNALSVSTQYIYASICRQKKMIGSDTVLNTYSAMSGDKLRHPSPCYPPDSLSLIHVCSRTSSLFSLN